MQTMNDPYQPLAQVPPFLEMLRMPRLIVAFARHDPTDEDRWTDLSLWVDGSVSEIHRNDSGEMIMIGYAPVVGPVRMWFTHEQQEQVLTELDALYARSKAALLNTPKEAQS